MAKPPTEPIPFSMDADWLFPRLARHKITFCGSFTIANNLGEVSTKAQAVRVCPHHFSSTVYSEGVSKSPTKFSKAETNGFLSGYQSCINEVMVAELFSLFSLNCG
ncbi:hypothetical protein CMV_019980 [Castanea mollissima]|uniref:Uncharacterized protein n=1 Tax=Castanea mollissima TaxID=60419 RepID=A0A8J4QZQ1_9ROSI|nr:hypothetical protein CMV_019980 [Castanea mollissima]